MAIIGNLAIKNIFIQFIKHYKKEQKEMPKRTKIIMNECKNATSEDQMYRIMEELTRIKKIDLTFKGVKVA